MKAGVPWSTGDVVEILTALAYVVVGLWLNKANRKFDRIAVLLGTGLSLGPLLLIVADPLLQVLGLELNLVQLVVLQARAVLWWGAAVAVLYIMKDLVESAPH